jgi:hypothetical protein
MQANIIRRGALSIEWKLNARMDQVDVCFYTGPDTKREKLEADFPLALTRLAFDGYIAGLQT